LLTLLKIIGIVLLSVLGLFLVLILIVLFVPVRYRVKGYYKDDFVCHGKATWLLHLITVSIDFEKELVTSFKILGIDISSILSRKGESTTNNRNTKKDSVNTPLEKKENDLSPKSFDSKEKPEIEPLEKQPQLRDAQKN